MNSGKIIVSILGTLAAGAALGVLFAPEKGSKTRKRIFKSGENITGDLEEKFHAFIAGMKDKYESLSHEAALKAKSGARKSEKIKEEISTNGNKL